MTRRFRLVLVAVATATTLDLAVLPMRMAPLAVIGVWLGSVVVAVILAGALDSAIDRHAHHAMYSQVLTEARRALNERTHP